ncbi:hypothetical protein AMECASPLE_018091, partial [Ameca splendens]
ILNGCGWFMSTPGPPRASVPIINAVSVQFQIGLFLFPSFSAHAQCLDLADLNRRQLAIKRSGDRWMPTEKSDRLRLGELCP